MQKHGHFMSAAVQFRALAYGQCRTIVQNGGAKICEVLVYLLSANRVWVIRSCLLDLSSPCAGALERWRLSVANHYAEF